MQFIVNASQAGLSKLGVTADDFGEAIAKTLKTLELESGESIYLQDPEVVVVVSAWTSAAPVDGYKVGIAF